jgi:hypothetical protein
MSLKKSILFFCILVFFIVTGDSQGVEMFTYIHLEAGDMVVPKFDNSRAEGIEGIAVWTEDKYVHKLINSVLSHVLSRTKRESLHLESAVMIAFNRQGEVINCKFFLERNDRKILTEDELYRIYMKLKKVEINPYKVRINPDPKTGNKLPDFAVISGSLINKAGREKMDK